MARNARYHYYVEGAIEKKFVDYLKDKQMIRPGKADVFNAVQDYFNLMHIRSLPPESIIILIFDTDRNEPDTIVRNIKFLKKHTNIKEVICIPQATNFEEEMIRCTSIQRLREFFDCARDSEFKRKFLEEKHLDYRLKSKHFEFKKLWSVAPPQKFIDLGITNMADKIKFHNVL